jgi:hypothetical protein
MIWYIAVSNFHLLLVELAVGEGRLREIAHKILCGQQCPDNDGRVSYGAGE